MGKPSSVLVSDWRCPDCRELWKNHHTKLVWYKLPQPEIGSGFFAREYAVEVYCKCGETYWFHREEGALPLDIEM